MCGIERQRHKDVRSSSEGILLEVIGFGLSVWAIRRCAWILSCVSSLERQL